MKSPARCPVCRRRLEPFDRVYFRWENWRRGEYLGCGACREPGGEQLGYEVWELPWLCGGA